MHTHTNGITATNSHTHTALNRLAEHSTKKIQVVWWHSNTRQSSAQRAATTNKLRKTRGGTEREREREKESIRERKRKRG